MVATPITQGDTPTFRFTVTDANTGDPFDLTDYIAEFLIKRSMQDSDAAAELLAVENDGIAVPYTLEDGILDVTVPASVSSNLRLGKLYPFFLRLTNPDTEPNIVFIPERGAFLAVLPDQE